MHAPRLLATLALLAGALFACSSPPPCASWLCAGDASAPDARADDVAAPDARDAPDAPTPDGPVVVTSLAIDPADATLVAANGAAATQAFRLFGVGADGARVPIAGGAWSVDHPRAGTISAATGTFTANGVAGADVRVEAVATVDGRVLRASTNLSVRVTREVFPETPPRELFVTRFARPTVEDFARASPVVYPLDNVVMPNNVPPPVVQWTGGDLGDMYRVRVEKPHASVTAYVLHEGTGFRFAWPVDAQGWRALAETDVDALARVSVDRWDGATREVIEGVPVRVRLARGSIYGAVYYWNLGDEGSRTSSLARISADTARRDNLVPYPPASGGRPGDCIGCHTVSRDGRYLAASIGLSTAVVFDLTRDLSTDPPPTEYPVDTTNFVASSFSPDNTRLIVSTSAGGGPAGGTLAMINPRNGTSVAATGLPSGLSANPSWSPDGDAIAFIQGGNDDPYGAAVGDLALLPRVGADAFGPVTTLHRGTALASAPEGGNADSHPTWTPDSRALVFHHGPRSISGQRGKDFPGALYWIPRAGGAPVRLDRAMGGAARSDSYWPTFSPFVTAEREPVRRYYWLAFYSLRPYGNATAGTLGRERRQLWVTAIDASAAPGTDPSSVPYWLPGQDIETNNVAAYWAPGACRENGASCTTSSECCSGTCRPDPAMPSRTVCQPPPPAECRRRGQSCSSASDCCAGMMLQCISNVCEQPAPG